MGPCLADQVPYLEDTADPLHRKMLVINSPRMWSRLSNVCHTDRMSSVHRRLESLVTRKIIFSPKSHFHPNRNSWKKWKKFSCAPFAKKSLPNPSPPTVLTTSARYDISRTVGSFSPI